MESEESEMNTRQLSTKTHAIGEFLDWVQDKYDGQLMTYVPASEMGWEYGWVPLRKSTSDLLVEWAGIDQREFERSVTTMCPHGDKTCPCPDGDLCHHVSDERTRAMSCPRTGLADCTECITEIA